MNSLGIKRGEESRHFGAVLVRILPHLISLSILLIWGVWGRSQYSADATEPILVIIGALILSPIMILTVMTYFVVVSVLMVVVRFTPLQFSALQKNLLIAVLSGLSTFGVVARYWSDLP